MMYYTVLLYQIVMIFMVTTIAAAFYTTYLLLVQHACTLFSIITERLHRPFQKDQNYDWTLDKVKDSYDWIVDITKRYEEAIKFTIGRPYKKDSRDVYTSGVIDDSYEWVKEIVRRYGNAIEFVNMINSATERVYMIEIFFATLLVIIDFLYLFHSLEMLKSYQVSWYELPLRCQKALPLLIMRSTKPCVISIGGIFVASHDFFARFVNTSLSYAMICSKMR
ncbi:hypothetical protein KPH14_005923 [Odynerus spinipes]|uniref:Odorant receptor n=1 Tax=Odynerus spinipes TaxID=1348599 RepID=A0AAD9RJG7_9HYME|nr:hypothetical protein KPH14_005923 [Odynerus spinipes]